MRGEYLGFLRTVGSALNPGAYFSLSESKIKNTFKYLIKLIFFAFVIMCLLYIPFLVQLPAKIDDLFGTFSVLNVTINTTMKQPIVLFPNDPGMMITIDTSSNATQLSQGSVLLTNDYLIRKRFLFGQEVINLGGYSNLLAHRDLYRGIAIIAFAALLPTILVLTFLYFLVKYLVIGIVASLLALIVVRVVRYEIDYKSILNISLYATTISVFVELFTTPFDIVIPYIKIAWIGYLLSLFYLIYGIRETGFFDKEHRLKKRRGYLGDY